MDTLDTINLRRRIGASARLRRTLRTGARLAANVHPQPVLRLTPRMRVYPHFDPGLDDAAAPALVEMWREANPSVVRFWHKSVMEELPQFKPGHFIHAERYVKDPLRITRDFSPVFTVSAGKTDAGEGGPPPRWEAKPRFTVSAAEMEAQSRKAEEARRTARRGETFFAVVVFGLAVCAGIAIILAVKARGLFG